MKNKKPQENTEYNKSIQISGVTEIIKGQIKTEKTNKKANTEIPVRRGNSALISRQSRKDSV